MALPLVALHAGSVGEALGQDRVGAGVREKGGVVDGHVHARVRVREAWVPGPGTVAARRPLGQPAKNH